MLHLGMHLRFRNPRRSQVAPKVITETLIVAESSCLDI